MDLMSLLPWITFNVVVVGLLALDLGVFHRTSHTPSLREAIWWSVFWIALSLAFNAFVFAWRGSEAGVQFFTGYVVEKSLSVDNIFVIVMIFTAFAVPATYQHRVLIAGVLGAIIMRGILILIGSVLIERLHWILYVFGAFLVFTAWRIATTHNDAIHTEQNPLVKLARRFFPVTTDYEQDRFFVRRGTRIWATPLLLVLIVIETTDLVFAVDSIPAIFAITTDPFIVYTSNICAILGLRSLYFVLAGTVDRFIYLKYGLAAILGFVGIKMLLLDIYKIPIAVSLGVICTLLAISIVASLLRTRRDVPANTPVTKPAGGQHE